MAAKLRSLGHTVYDDTDEVGATQSQNLNNIIRNSNSHAVDLVISFHLNASDGNGQGVEVLYYDQKDLAAKISAQLAKDIGWRDRGAETAYRFSGIKWDESTCYSYRIRIY